MATVSSFNPPGRASRRDFDAMAFFADSSRSTCIPGRLERLMMASWLPSWELELRDTGDEALLLWLSHSSSVAGVNPWPPTCSSPWPR
jgi:hypothetical protein